jgi:ApaG protein
MQTRVTNGIKVSVISKYEPDYSSPVQQHYVFTYRIFIENKSEYTVQLLARHWYIYDSNGKVIEVQGEGVIGQQPVLEPGEIHQYVSGSNLKTSMGKMKGHYLMERVFDGAKFEVEIPEFSLIVPFKLN